MQRELVDRLTKELLDRGLLIEAGWIALKVVSVPPTAGPVQIEEMRNAFFAGAQHVFGSMMGLLEEGEEATKGDLHTLDLIKDELDAFIADFKARRLRGMT